MTSAEFEAQLRQSVADHVALVHSSAEAAKARIGSALPKHQVPETPKGDPLFDEPAERPQRRGPAVNFFAEEDLPPEPAQPGGPGAESLPDGAIAFDDFEGGNVDDEGIPVWEDPL